MRRLIHAALALLLLAAPAAAQAPVEVLVIVVAACGTPPPGLTYTPGQRLPLTMDTTGTLCTPAGGGGGGGGAVTVANGADVTQGAKGDAKSTATDTTPITAMSVWKQISASVQSIAAYLTGTLATTGAGGTFPSTVADGADVAEGATTDAAASAGGTGTLSAKLRNTTALLNTGNGSAASTATSTNATAAALGTTADAVCGTPTGTCTLAALIKYLNNAMASAIPAGANLIGNVGTGYPAGSTPLTASTTGTTGATTATLAGTSGKSTYICGFSIRANATAAATADSTVTGSVTGTLHYTQWTAPLASGIGLTEQIFSPCVIASATNTGIAVISAAPGTGGVVSVTAWGFQL